MLQDNHASDLEGFYSSNLLLSGNGSSSLQGSLGVESAGSEAEMESSSLQEGLKNGGIRANSSLQLRSPVAGDLASPQFHATCSALVLSQPHKVIPKGHPKGQRLPLRQSTS